MHVWAPRRKLWVPEGPKLYRVPDGSPCGGVGGMIGGGVGVPGGGGGIGPGGGGGGGGGPPSSNLIQRLDAEAQRIADSVADDTALTSLKAITYGVDVPKVSTNGAVLKHGIQNSQAVFRFDGARRHTVATSGWSSPVSSAAASLYFVVANTSVATSSRYFYGGSATGWFAYLGNVYSAPDHFWSVTWDTGQTATGLIPSDGNFHVISINCDGSVLQLYKDNLLENEVNPVTITTVDMASLQIGHYNNSSLFVGDLAEVLIYAEAHNDTQRSAVAAYLGTRWGITVTP